MSGTALSASASISEIPNGIEYSEIPVDGVPSVFDSVAVVSVKPGDVILFRSPDRLSNDQRKHYAKMMEAVFPAHEIIILEAECDIAVLRLESL